MPQIVNKLVKLKLVGLNGNAFALMGAFQRQAKREGWTEAEVKSVLDVAMKGDYSHLLTTLSDHCENGGYHDDDDEDEDE